MKLKRRILSGALALTMLAGGFFINSGPASAEDPLTYTPTQSDIDFAAAALAAEPNWAFDVTSVPLHNAILVKYSTIDSNTDGYISKTEAAAMVGALDVSNQGISGTIKGIENFNHIANLRLFQNNLTGELPVGISGWTNLYEINLGSNNLSGGIPSDFGNFPNITTIALHGGNQFNGPFPQFGNLPNIKIIFLMGNMFTGNVPNSYGNYTSLQKLGVKNIDGDGLLPTTFTNLTNLTELYTENFIINDVQGTDEWLTDNLTQAKINDVTGELINMPPQAVASLQAQIDHAQSLLDLRIDAEGQVGTLLTLGEDNLATGITQTEITNAQTAVDLLPDGSTVKVDLQAKIDLAQQILDAIVHVDALLTADGANRATGTTQADIDAVQIEVTALPDGTLKAELQAKIDIAQNLLDAETQVGDLLVDNKTALATGVTQGVIDAAQTAVTALPDGTTKTNLQADIDLAKAMLDAKTQVNSLLTENNTNLAIGVTATEINDAQTLVDALSVGTLQDGLQVLIDLANDMLNAKTHVDALLTTDGANVASGVTQGTLDNAQTEVTALPDGTLKDELQAKIDTAQALLDAVKLVDELLSNDKANLESGVTQELIDQDKAIVNALPDGTTKTALLEDVAIAQKLLDATKLVDGLLTDDKANLESGVTQDTINNAKTSVNALPEGDTKDSLLAAIDLAQKILDAKKGVYDLFDDTGKIKDVINQDTLNKAKEAVNGLPDGTTKNDLLALIDEAQKQLNAKNTVDPTPVQPSERGTSIKSLENVDTGDDSNILLYGMGLLLAAAGLSLVIRRKMVKK